MRENAGGSSIMLVLAISSMQDSLGLDAFWSRATRRIGAVGIEAVVTFLRGVIY